MSTTQLHKIYIWVVRLHIPDRTFMAWSPHTPLVLVRTITSSTSSIYHTSSTRLIIHSNTHVVSATTAHHHQRMVRGGTTFREEYSIFLYTYIFIYTLLCILWKKPWYFCPTKFGVFFSNPSKEKIIEFPAQWDSQTAASSDRFGWQWHLAPQHLSRPLETWAQHVRDCSKNQFRTVLKVPWFLLRSWFVK